MGTDNSYRERVYVFNTEEYTVDQLRQHIKGLPPEASVRIRPRLGFAIELRLGWHGKTLDEIGESFESDMLEAISRECLTASLEVDLMERPPDNPSMDGSAIVSLQADALAAIITELLARRATAC